MEIAPIEKLESFYENYSWDYNFEINKLELQKIHLERVKLELELNKTTEECILLKTQLKAANELLNAELMAHSKTKSELASSTRCSEELRQMFLKYKQHFSQADRDVFMNLKSTTDDEIIRTDEVLSLKNDNGCADFREKPTTSSFVHEPVNESVSIKMSTFESDVYSEYIPKKMRHRKPVIANTTENLPQLTAFKQQDPRENHCGSNEKMKSTNGTSPMTPSKILRKNHSIKAIQSVVRIRRFINRGMCFYLCPITHTGLPCDICQKYFFDENSLYEHKRNSHDEKPANETFALKETLKSPNATHSSYRSFRCSICNNRFNTANDRNAHIQEIHHVANKCTTGDESFVQKGHLQQHQSVALEENLKHHEATHSYSSQKPFQCSICGKWLKTAISRYHHIRIVHEGGAESKCSYCDKKFKQKSLKIHIRKSHRPASEKPHKCATCDKTFIWESRLKQHQVVHTSERPHKCTMCEKSFKSCWGKQKHQRDVHAGFCFNCEHCEKVYRNKRNLSRHTKKVHSQFLR